MGAEAGDAGRRLSLGVAAGAEWLGPLAGLLAIDQLTDVLVNAGGQVWIDRGHGLEPAPVTLQGEAEARALAQALAARAGRRLDDAMPWAAARLPGGLRAHVIIPPVAAEGTHISLRVLRPARADLGHLVTTGTVPARWKPVFEALTASGVGYLISGGTGAGKTTLLAALLSLVPTDERMVLVEDVAELRPWHPHVVRLEARQANVEGRGAVTLDDLVRQALRMRPDRLVVGECRGAEVRGLLAALNTGHSGGCATVHANSVRDVPARLTALGGAAGMSPQALAAQAAAALQIVVHIERPQGGPRRVRALGVVRLSAEGLLTVHEALTWDGTTEHRGPAWVDLAEHLGLGT